MRKENSLFTPKNNQAFPAPDVDKRLSRREKERKILMILIEHYIKTGRAVGSHALKGESILDISSATIRNYFSSLEAEGYLKQQHTSGGRIPQQKAYKLYADYCFEQLQQEKKETSLIHEEGVAEDEKMDSFEEGLSTNLEPTELIASIQLLMSKISKRLSLAVVGSAPRFDQDAISDIRYVYIDPRRLLAIIVTEFGLIHTTVLAIDRLQQGTIKKAERFARMKLFHEIIEEKALNQDELEIAKKLYQETMSSYFVMYSSVSEEDIFKTGFSNLFSNADFQDPSILKSSLFLFENNPILRKLLRSSVIEERLQYWIGEEISIHCDSISDQNSFVAVPYHIGSKAVGALGVLSHRRTNYKEIFRVLNKASLILSKYLTKGLIKHRITFRMPEAIRFDSKEVYALDFSQPYE